MPAKKQNKPFFIKNTMCGSSKSYTGSAALIFYETQHSRNSIVFAAGA